MRIRCVNVKPVDRSLGTPSLAHALSPLPRPTSHVPRPPTTPRPPANRDRVGFLTLHGPAGYVWPQEMVIPAPQTVHLKV